MKNLENYGVLEMSTLESTQTIGGDGIVKEVWDVLKEIDAGWDTFKARLKDGWDSYGECAC